MVILDAYSISQLANDDFNDFLNVNFRKGRATKALTIHVYDAKGNNQFEPNTGNPDEFVFFTSEYHGAPWVREGHSNTGKRIAFSPNFTPQQIIDAVEALKDVNGFVDVDYIVPNFPYYLSQWKS